jgi:hypothetical protein
VTQRATVTFTVTLFGCVHPSTQEDRRRALHDQHRQDLIEHQ